MQNVHKKILEMVHYYNFNWYFFDAE